MINRTSYLLLAAIFLMTSHFAQARGKDFLKDCGALLAKEPITLDVTKPNEFIDDLVKFMNRRVIGQEQAVREIAKSVEIALQRLGDPNKPLGTFLLTGPTGVGKTETVRALVAGLGGDPTNNLIRIDCGQDQGDHDLSRLKGAPPGTVGYDEIAPLDQSNLIKTRIRIKLKDGRTFDINVVLLDEIEKGPPGLESLLMGALDHGVIQMSNHTESDLHMTIIFGTMNLGSAAVEKIIQQKEAQLATKSTDFRTAEDADLTGRLDTDLGEQIVKLRNDAILKHYKPEFVGRWEAIIPFFHLGPAEYARILQKILAGSQLSVFARGSAKFGLVLDEEARKYLLNIGTDRELGARPLESAVKRNVTVTLARLLATQQIQDGDVLELEFREGQPSAIKIAQNLSRNELLKFADAEYPDQGMIQAIFDEAIRRPEDNRDVAELLRLFPEAAISLFDANQGSPSVAMAATDGLNGNSLMRIIKVDNHYISLLRTSATKVVAKTLIEIPANAKSRFPADQLKTYTEAEVRKFIAKFQVDP